MPFQLDTSFTYLLSRLANQLQEQFNQDLAVLDISWSQWLGVYCVARAIADTPAGIATTLGVSRPVVTRLLDRLQKKGLVQRIGDREDRRSVTVRISDQGRLLVDYMESAACQHEDNIMQALGPDCLRELQRALQKL